MRRARGGESALRPQGSERRRCPGRAERTVQRRARVRCSGVLAPARPCPCRGPCRGPRGEEGGACERPRREARGLGSVLAWKPGFHDGAADGARVARARGGESVSKTRGGRSALLNSSPGKRRRPLHPAPFGAHVRIFVILWSRRSRVCESLFRVALTAHPGAQNGGQAESGGGTAAGCSRCGSAETAGGGLLEGSCELSCDSSEGPEIGLLCRV